MPNLPAVSQVIVQGLPFHFTWQPLKDMFKPIGGVVSADIVKGPDGRSKGWGTVNFETEADAERAIQVQITMHIVNLFYLSVLFLSCSTLFCSILSILF